MKIYIYTVISLIFFKSGYTQNQYAFHDVDELVAHRSSTKKTLKVDTYYTIENESKKLILGTDGELDFLWNVFNKKFCYFIRYENGEIIQLTNNKNPDGSFNFKYRKILNEIISEHSMSANNLNFTLYDIIDFVDIYNNRVDSNHKLNSSLIKKNGKFKKRYYQWDVDE